MILHQEAEYTHCKVATENLGFTNFFFFAYSYSESPLWRVCFLESTVFFRLICHSRCALFSPAAIDFHPLIEGMVFVFNTVSEYYSDAKGKIKPVGTRLPF